MVKKKLMIRVVWSSIFHCNPRGALRCHWIKREKRMMKVFEASAPLPKLMVPWALTRWCLFFIFSCRSFLPCASTTTLAEAETKMMAAAAVNRPGRLDVLVILLSFCRRRILGLCIMVSSFTKLFDEGAMPCTVKKRHDGLKHKQKKEAGIRWR